jgi:hypothetical protein
MMWLALALGIPNKPRQNNPSINRCLNKVERWCKDKIIDLRPKGVVDCPAWPLGWPEDIIVRLGTVRNLSVGNIDDRLTVKGIKMSIDQTSG